MPSIDYLASFLMQTLLRIPVVFFSIAALLGLILRWHFFQPISGFVYPYWLHAHSHLMFLGWVFNTLLCGFVVAFIPLSMQNWYRKVLLIINALVLGMLIAFPLQGYGVYSIIISTLHTFFSIIFLVRFYSTTRMVESEPLNFARIASFFFLLSSLGPFAVGALVANNLGHTSWYHLAVYFYLHFQYNGVFTFGVFSLLLSWFSKIGIGTNRKRIRIFRWLLLVSCFPAYALSTLWTEPGLLIYVAGFGAAILQLVSLFYLFRFVVPTRESFWKKFAWLPRTLLAVALVSFIIKLFLQMASAFPYVAMLAYDVRNYVMAYLHLVLLGAISFSLLAWYHGNGYITIKPIMLVLLVLGFAGSELALIATDIIPHQTGTSIILGSSFLLALAILLTAAASQKNKQGSS